MEVQKSQKGADDTNMTTPTVLHAADYKVEDGITYLPLYMTPLL